MPNPTSAKSGDDKAGHDTKSNGEDGIAINSIHVA
jgi:hypothetical protein